MQVTSGISTFYDTTQSSSATTGAVVINGGVGIAKNVNIGGNLTVTGTTTFNGGTITLGDANTDNVVFTADVDSNIIPDDDDTYDLGSSTKEWQDLFIDGTAHVDVLDVDETAFVTTKLTVGTGVTIQDNGNVAIAGITTTTDTINIAADNKKLLVGASQDLEIFHDGSHSFISNTGTGGLILSDASSGFIYLRSSDIRLQNAAGDENMIIATADGAVSIHHDNTETLTTLATGVKVGSGVTMQRNGNLAVAGISTLGGQANAVGGVHCSTDGVGNGIKVGAGEDLIIQHNGTNSFIDNNTGDLYIQTTGSGDDILIEAADDFQVKVQGSEVAIDAIGNGEVILYHNANARITTTDDGADFGGTGSIRVPNGTTGERNSSPAAGDFRYNTTTGKFEGYTDEWGDIGGSGGVEETDTSVSTTSATSCGSFAIASFRSASIIAQITQGSNYQVGRYLVIHDGTNVTTIEESAVATGSMLGTFEGVINSSNLEFRVTMGSSSSATVTTKIDTVTV